MISKGSLTNFRKRIIFWFSRLTHWMNTEVGFKSMQVNMLFRLSVWDGIVTGLTIPMIQLALKIGQAHLKKLRLL